VRIYQCQIVKKPVNALVRSVEPAATLSRMLKKSASVVLTSLRGLTYRSVRLPLCSLRPCWTAFLSILRGCSLLATDMQAIEVLLCQNGFSQPASRLIPLAERARYG
jgi:hypothetical protein